MASEVSQVTARNAIALRFDEQVVGVLRERLPEVATQTVAAVTAEVPGYTGALSGSMGDNIEAAVQMALAGFLKLAAGSRETDPSTPLGPTLDGAYALGRGEARSGRSMDALLAAYRVGARVAWRELADSAARAGVDAGTMAQFAELVFAYIDELSAASVAGHTDELSTSGRVRERYRERLGQQLLAGAGPDTLLASAERAGWTVPGTLTAVLLPAAQVRGVLASLGPETLLLGEDLPGFESGEGRPLSLLLVPDVDGTGRRHLARVLEGGRPSSVRHARGRKPGRPTTEQHGRSRWWAERPVLRSTARTTWPTWSSPRMRTRWPTYAHEPSPRWPSCARPAGNGSRRRCGPGCCTKEGATPSPPSYMCTRRPSATAWASCGTSTATASTTRARSSIWSCRSRIPRLPDKAHWTRPRLEEDPMDARSWDERYAGTDLVWSPTPNQFVEAELAGEPVGTAVDLAAGEGRNAIWLAQQGWTVEAVDFSQVGLDKGREMAAGLGVEEQLTWHCANALSWTGSDVDLVVVAYLQLPADERGRAIRNGFDALRTGGTLLVVAHDSSNLTEGTGGPQDPDVLYTAEDVLADLEGRSYEVVKAERVTRKVDDGHGGDEGRTAYDCLVRLRAT